MMDLIVSWLCSAIAEAFEGFSELFTSIFGYDIAEFNYTFTFAATAYDVIRDVALAIALIISVWQVFVFFFKGADSAPSTPIRAALNTVLAVGFIFYGNYILEAILKFCQYPFDTLNSIDAAKWGADFGHVITKSIHDAFAEISILLYLILLLMIAFSMVKLLLEIVERYVVTFVLLYLSPLAAATLASSTTNGIYKKFFTMFISQCLLILLNVWCLKMACSGLSLSSYDGASPVISLLLCYAFLRVSAKMDSYINQLGLNSAITGVGLGAEIMATGATIMGGGRSGGSGGAGNSNGGGNKVLGAAKTVAQYANRYTPVSGAAKKLFDTAKGGIKGGSEAYRSGAGLVANTKAVLSGATSGATRGWKESDNFINKIDNIAKPSNLNQQLVDKTKDDPVYDKNIKTLSENQHLAHSGFSYVQNTQQTVDDPQKVAAIAKGLGVGNQSKEAEEFIKAGFGQADGVPTTSLTLDQNGIHGEYNSQDGYRHKMDVYNQSQYAKLTTQQREGLEKFRTEDGHRYYIGTSKTRLEPIPKQEESKNAEPKTEPEEPTPNTESSAEKDGKKQEV